MSYISEELWNQILEKEPLIKKALEIEKAYFSHPRHIYYYQICEDGNKGLAHALVNEEYWIKAEIAVNMLSEGISLNLIPKLVGLSPSEVKVIKKKYGNDVNLLLRDAYKYIYEEDGLLETI
jgi:hypothetical protein